MNYSKWIDEQGEKIARNVWAPEHRGRYEELAVYVMPADGDKWGSLELAYEAPHGSVGAVHFPSLAGTRVSSVPSQTIPSMLYHLCQDMPVCGA